MKRLSHILLAAAVSVGVLSGVAVAQQYEPRGAATSERVLSQAELDDLIERSRQAGLDASAANSEVRYLGATSDVAVESYECCETVDEQVEDRTEVQETTTYIDAVTEREIIQPIERTLIQPIERRLVQGRTETVTEAVQYDEERLPVIVQEDPVPPVVENIITEESTETREEFTETFVDTVTQRDIIQPIERVTVVPVQRRIARPRTETITAETRFETITAPVQVEAEAVPAVNEYTTPQISEVTVDEVTETFVDVVTQRDVIQPVERTVIQPIERRILRGTTETVTNPTEFREEVLPVRVEEETAPAVVENIIPQVTERVVYEVEDVYVDQVTRNVIQPVVRTTIQPIERRVVQGRKETVTADTIFEQDILPGRVDADPIPETVVNYIPQETVLTRDEVTETFFEAVTQRDIIQPVVITMIQPIERRIIQGRTETLTNATQYETIQAAMIVLDTVTACSCLGTTGGMAQIESTPVETCECDCECCDDK